MKRIAVTLSEGFASVTIENGAQKAISGTNLAICIDAMSVEDRATLATFAIHIAEYINGVRRDPAALSIGRSGR